MTAKVAVSIAEAARLLSVSRSHAYRMHERDELPSFRMGGRVLVSKKGLDELVAERCAKADK